MIFDSECILLVRKTYTNEEVSNLTLHHTIPTFNDSNKRSLVNTLWEKEKTLVSSIFSLYTMPSTLPRSYFDFLFIFIFSTAITYNLGPKFCRLIKSLRDSRFDLTLYRILMSNFSFSHNALCYYNIQVTLH